jgi:hypothetical protein
VWANGALFPSANFRGSRVLANGPIRVLFELTYDAWDAGGQKVSEVKRIQLDAGHRLNRFESTYRVPAPRALQQGAGIRKNAAADINLRRDLGGAAHLGSVQRQCRLLGCAVLVDPRDLVDAPKRERECCS